MKKILVLFLALIIAAGVCACGAPKATDPGSTEAQMDKAAIREAFNKATAYIESNIDMSKMTKSTQDDDNGNDLYNYWSSDGGNNATFSNEILIAGNAVEIGKTTVKDTESFDLEVSKSQKTVKPNEFVSVELTKNGKTCMLMTGDNLTGKEANIDDMPIGSVSAAFDEYALPFKYGGLTDKSTLKDVISLIGEPNNTVNLSVSQTGSVIDVCYTKTTKDAGMTIDDNLTVFLYYDAASDSAMVKSVQLSRSIIE